MKYPSSKFIRNETTSQFFSDVVKKCESIKECSIFLIKIKTNILKHLRLNWFDMQMIYSSSQYLRSSYTEIHINWVFNIMGTYALNICIQKIMILWKYLQDLILIPCTLCREKIEMMPITRLLDLILRRTTYPLYSTVNYCISDLHL